MNHYKAFLMLVAFMTYMIMAGLLTQIGIVIRPISESLNVSLTESAAMFSYLTGGTLIGTVISMFVYGKFKIKTTLRVVYSIFVITTVALTIFNFRMHEIVSTFLVVLGVSCGVGLSGGAVIISMIFEEDKRASAFIATDCAFSASGFIFPMLATVIISANLEWTYCFYGSAILATLIVISTFTINYPENKSNHSDANKKKMVGISEFRKIITPRVMLMGFSLCIYLFAQNVFLTWGPSYMTEIFGISPEQSGRVVSNYWGPSVLGLIAASFLVNKIPARKMLLSVVFIAIILTTYLGMTHDTSKFLFVTLALGFMTSCIYKLGISVGSQQITSSPAVLVTFLLTCGTVGSSIAPVLSAYIVGKFGLKSAMNTTTISLISVFLCIALCLILEQRSLNKKSLRRTYD